jgi:hypothetical protein
LDVDERIRIVFILLPRNRDSVFSREEEKEIEELYLLQKNA